jgi:hypothetical protein
MLISAAVLNSTVYPSGAAFATASAPIMPLAPAPVLDDDLLADAVLHFFLRPSARRDRGPRQAEKAR